MTEKSKLIRSHNNFKEEIENIREERKIIGISKLSYTKITSLITRHKFWPKMKQEIINYAGYEDDE